MSVKQVLVMRKDLKIRRGKEISQGSHGSIAWLCNRIRPMLENDKHKPKFSKAELEWLTGSFAKITLQVESEKELLEVYQEAKKANLVCELITDAGKTEFGGIPTHTCIAIGPDSSEKIDKITGHLKLY